MWGVWGVGVWGCGGVWGVGVWGCGVLGVDAYCWLLAAAMVPPYPPLGTQLPAKYQREKGSKPHLEDADGVKVRATVVGVPGPSPVTQCMHCGVCAAAWRRAPCERCPAPCSPIHVSLRPPGGANLRGLGGCPAPLSRSAPAVRALESSAVCGHGMCPLRSM